MKNIDLVRFVAAPLMVLALSLPAWAADSTATTTCKDGTTSTSTGKGTCSGHGGVQKASASPAAAAAPAAPAAATPAAPAATGCSHHLQGRHDLHLHRQGHLQRSRRRAEGLEEQACGGSHRRCPRGGCLGACCGSAGRYRGRTGPGNDSDRVEVGADHRRRQYQPDGRDGEVQGRHLFEVAAPQRNVFQSRRRRRMADG